MFKPTISYIIEGSYKEGFELTWERKGNIIEIDKSSLKTWRPSFNSIAENIRSGLAKYYPDIEVIWM